mgnify:FL=1|tara:strand:+ start:622 stop:852 length:231 start_codon:yes stop_codon:yes gene_type:complete
MKFNDEVIAHIAKILQMAILTGTDIIDHLRMVTLTQEGNELFLDEEYASIVEENIQKMLDNALTSINSDDPVLEGE